ncbi:hypothetical protein SPRG_06626 [Saprolegnia parasitica CBS 223.65]|uniref:Transmembrane protein n=1 Tax=Saprolegnia parasitica (strain CBS 223.65) TaxID=695850 RepID=A0A067CD13_SAPPC|nr:hypothetical protein SPRG_06626 [Saprolegnia parasitica CBS 223.65]KDO28388.1 hypothetical protein SPRG_06626 [Saprolegnia parasitica CBS 223.65]|eukprot:XP_012200830.1 hypothetical protein SPRG_06626 [Saprolegnia parasitica CBS 223.65]
MGHDDKIWLYCESADDDLTSYEDVTLGLTLQTATITKPLDEGALRPGGALDLSSREAIGLLGQYVAVGMIYGLLPSLTYPLFTQYLNFDGYHSASYSVLVNMCWSLKIFFGLITDCFPIGGYKRKPYMLLGWLLSLGSICAMSFLPFPSPYLGRGLAHKSDAVVHRLRAGNLTDLSPTERALVNESATEDATLWILLSCACSFGYILADVAADAMVVQYAQREPIAIRGRLQSMIYATRFASSLVPNVVTGFCMNSFEYGGDFSWSLSPNYVYATLLLPCAVALYCTLFLIVDERAEKPYLRDYVGRLWELIQLRVVWQICIFRFCNNVFFNFDATVVPLITSTWAGVEPLAIGVFSILNALFTAVCIYACGKWGLHWNWRVAIALSTIAIVVIDATVLYLPFVGGFMPDAFPSAIRFVISAYCAVEIADIGNEGVVHSLVTSIVNLAIPVATVCYKYINSFFHVTRQDMVDDTYDVRFQVTMMLTLSFGMKLLSLAWLVLLPPQKAAVQWLKQRGGSNAIVGGIVLGVYFLAMAFSIGTNVMALFPSTSCYRIAGGNGQPTFNRTTNATVCLGGF